MRDGRRRNGQGAQAVFRVDRNCGLLGRGAYRRDTVVAAMNEIFAAVEGRPKRTQGITSQTIEAQMRGTMCQITEYELDVLREEIARLTAERDTARAETAALIERAAVLCDGTAKYHMSDPDDIDVVGLTAREIRTLTPANAKAALAARDKAIREQALRECVAYHQGEIDRLDAQIADNEAYMKRSGREVSEANKYCRDHQNSHRIARDAILALI